MITAEANHRLHAELSSIDENLMRAELTAAQRASGTARRKAIYVELHPETAHGSNQGDKGRFAPSRQLGDTAERFTAETAIATGRSERAIQRDAERGERIAEPALAAVSGTPLDKGRYLDTLKKVPKPEQAARVERDLAARVFPVAPPAAPEPEILFETWIEQGRRWLATGTPDFQARAREALPFPEHPCDIQARCEGGAVGATACRTTIMRRLYGTINHALPASRLERGASGRPTKTNRSRPGPGRSGPAWDQTHVGTLPWTLEGPNLHRYGP